MKKSKNKLESLEADLIYIRGVYKKKIMDNVLVNKPTERLVKRYQAIEIQLWNLREDMKNGAKQIASNGS
tara:strand:+ start:786 stop:995 length:210 start_codon:yes stop_codon:yes gene_type:complete